MKGTERWRENIGDNGGKKVIGREIGNRKDSKAVDDDGDKAKAAAAALSNAEVGKRGRGGWVGALKT
jgi:hypothetical protein